MEETKIEKMSDGKSFIRSLAICHPSQATPILRHSTDDHLMAVQEMAQRILSGNIPIETKLPRKFKRRLYNIAYRHTAPHQIRRCLTQRGGNGAVLAGKVMKTLAQAAIPHIKSVGKTVLQEGISKGVDILGDCIKGSNKKKKKTSQEDQVPTSLDSPSSPSSDQDELDSIIKRAITKKT